MPVCLLPINKETVYEEVPKTTEYTGAQMDDEHAYETISTTEEDKSIPVSYTHLPFGNSATERTTGCAVQFAFATKNIKEADSKLIEC